MNLLLAEDERRLAGAIAQILRENKYQVDVAYDGADALAYALEGDYDAFICDVMLPLKNGFDVVGELRAAGVSTPTIMLTARTSLADKVAGLDAGADDYLTKPFQPAELLARLRALTRRTGEVVIDEQTVGDLTINLSTYDMSCNGRSVKLSYKEFEVMSLLVANVGRTVCKETFLSRIWGVESEASDNNVEAYISFLRKKLRFVKSTVEIVTQRKVGYRLEVPEAKETSARAVSAVGPVATG